MRETQTSEPDAQTFFCTLITVFMAFSHTERDIAASAVKKPRPEIITVSSKAIEITSA